MLCKFNVTILLSTSASHSCLCLIYQQSPATVIGKISKQKQNTLVQQKCKTTGKKELIQSKIHIYKIL